MAWVCELSEKREGEDEGEERRSWNDPDGRGADGEYKLKNVLFVDVRDKVLLYLHPTRWTTGCCWAGPFFSSSDTTIRPKIICVAAEVWKTHPDRRFEGGKMKASSKNTTQNLMNLFHARLIKIKHEPDLYHETKSTALNVEHKKFHFPQHLDLIWILLLLIPQGLL